MITHLKTSHVKITRFDDYCLGEGIEYPGLIIHAKNSGDIIKQFIKALPGHKDILKKYNAKENITVFEVDYEEPEKKTMRNLKSKTKQIISCRDLILSLLHASSPVTGISRMQMELFLTWKTLTTKTKEDYDYPYKFETPSQLMIGTLSDLLGLGLIEIITRNPNASGYSITPRGTQTILKHCKDKNISLEELKTKKKGWNELTNPGMLKLLHRKYPKYARKMKKPFS